MFPKYKLKHYNEQETLNQLNCRDCFLIISFIYLYDVLFHDLPRIKGSTYMFLIKRILYFRDDSSNYHTYPAQSDKPNHARSRFNDPAYSWSC